MSLLQIYQALISPDTTIRQNATTAMDEAVKNSYGDVLVSSFQLLNDKSIDISVRQVIGIYLKNIVVAQDKKLLAGKLELWNKLDSNVKQIFLNGLISSLNTIDTSDNIKFCSILAQTIAPYATICVKEKTWPDFFQQLFSILSQNKNQFSTLTSLLTLGFVCDDIEIDVLQESELSAIFQCYSQFITTFTNNKDIVLLEASYEALKNSMHLTENVLASEESRSHLLSQIMNGLNLTPKIKELSFECLSFIADNYYEHLQPYIETIFNFTIQTLNDPSIDPKVSLQALEFWLNLAEVEENVKSDVEDGLLDPANFKNYSLAATKPMVEILCMKMIQKSLDEIDDEDDEARLYNNCALLIEFFSNVNGAETFNLLFNFIVNNTKIGNSNEAINTGLIIFAAIVDGSPLDSVVELFLNLNIQALYNATNNEIIKESVIWLIVKLFSREIFNNQNVVFSSFNIVINGLLVQNEKIQTQSLSAIRTLCITLNGDSTEQTGLLSQLCNYQQENGSVWTTILTIFATSQSNELKEIAHGAINDIIASCPLDFLPNVFQLYNSTIEQLQVALNNNSTDNSVGEFCRTLCEILKRGIGNGIQVNNDIIANLLGTILTKQNSIAHHEALLALGPFSELCDKSFATYFKYFSDLIIEVISNNYDDEHLCILAVGIFGDFARALGNTFYVPIVSDKIVAFLISMLQNSQVLQSVKPHIFSVLGDIALSIEGSFTPYLDAVLTIVVGANRFTISENPTEDEIDNYHALRNSLLEVSTGILQGYKDSNRNHLSTEAYFANFFQVINTSIERIDNMTPECAKSLIGLIGDFYQFYGVNGKNSLQTHPHLSQFVETCSRNSDPEIREISNWTKSVIQSILRS